MWQVSLKYNIYIYIYMRKKLSYCIPFNFFSLLKQKKSSIIFCRCHRPFPHKRYFELSQDGSRCNGCETKYRKEKERKNAKRAAAASKVDLLSSEDESANSTSEESSLEKPPPTKMKKGQPKRKTKSEKKLPPLLLKKHPQITRLQSENAAALLPDETFISVMIKETVKKELENKKLAFI